MLGLRNMPAVARTGTTCREGRNTPKCACSAESTAKMCLEALGKIEACFSSFHYVPFFFFSTACSFPAQNWMSQNEWKEEVGWVGG